ncbi:hypothetical protein DL96DRAFT_725016 [Flagelloscypha sp. PMI_526]|nr:hypothetical protein DL96DRAFT_725016 [Flagelloscypha sp. PMI_526]
MARIILLLLLPHSSLFNQPIPFSSSLSGPILPRAFPQKRWTTGCIIIRLAALGRLAHSNHCVVQCIGRLELCNA